MVLVVLLLPMANRWAAHGGRLQLPASAYRVVVADAAHVKGKILRRFVAVFAALVAWLEKSRAPLYLFSGGNALVASIMRANDQRPTPSGDEPTIPVGDEPPNASAEPSDEPTIPGAMNPAVPSDEPTMPGEMAGGCRFRGDSTDNRYGWWSADE